MYIRKFRILLQAQPVRLVKSLLVEHFSLFLLRMLYCSFAAGLVVTCWNVCVCVLARRRNRGGEVGGGRGAFYF